MNALDGLVAAGWPEAHVARDIDQVLLSLERLTREGLLSSEALDAITKRLAAELADAWVANRIAALG